MDPTLIESTTVLNAQLGFLHTRLALIHISLDVYPFFVQPLLHLLLHNNRLDGSGNVNQPPRPWLYWEPFVNVSIVRDQCTIVCPRYYAENLFAPVMDVLSPALRKSVSISNEDYSAIVIGGEGLEAGQRVLDLTSPLAIAGISILFITSYYSDFILVPFSARAKVIRALEDRGFVFKADLNGESGHMTNPALPSAQNGHRRDSSGSVDYPPIPGTPPPKTVSDLQNKTFKLLKLKGISPWVDESLDLVTCAGIKDVTATSSATNYSDGKLQLGVIKCITALPPPRFFSLTLTDSESASLTLEKSAVSHFYNEGESLLLGKDGPEQVAITLDFKNLPFESTGIVCGVASRLIDAMKGRTGEVFNMSYLSTAKAGHVIVYADELPDAIEALRGAEQNGIGPH